MFLKKFVNFYLESKFEKPRSKLYNRLKIKL